MLYQLLKGMGLLKKVDKEAIELDHYVYFASKSEAKIIELAKTFQL
jgi:hypothetical protein